MNEQEHDRPLTRRELRLRELAAEDGTASEAAPEIQANDAETAQDNSHEQALEAQIEIDPLNPDGTPRTRRELRELRAAALAELMADANATEPPAEEDAELAEAETADAETAIAETADAADAADAEAADAEAADADAEPARVESAEVEPTEVEPASEERSDASDLSKLMEAPPSDDVDDSYGAPTEAFSLEELLEAVAPIAPTGDADAVAALFAEADDEADQSEDDAEAGDAEADDEEAHDAAPEDDAADEVEPDNLDVDKAASAESEPEDAEVDSDELLEEPAGGLDDDDVEVDDEDAQIARDGAVTTETVEGEIVGAPLDDADEEGDLGEQPDPIDAEAAETDDEAAEVVEDVVDVVEDAEDDEESVPELKTETAAYSFPDIQPPEEWRSVFDDPERAASIVPTESSGDFDDLISRAVAQEGSTGGTGTSALILPSHPGDTGGLSGPLGMTGELFITGSIELPKSLGETGGHAAFQDSTGLDSFLPAGDNDPLSTSESGPSPVSARSAVSARRRPEVPVVAEPTKDRSKTPLVLAISGGVLIVVLAGTVIYAATQGLFG